MKRICVYCGSNPGARPEYVAAAQDLGAMLAERDIELVYGGGFVGIMGEVSRAVLRNGGRVIGITPKMFVDMEVIAQDLTELLVVDSMHERKAKMAELSDGFITMPGGLGTFDEIFEILTWAQLGIHNKPCALLNICGYYDKLIEFLEHASTECFIKEEHVRMLLVDQKPDTLIDKLTHYQPPKIHKLFDR